MIEDYDTAVREDSQWNFVYTACWTSTKIYDTAVREFRSQWNFVYTACWTSTRVLQNDLSELDDVMNEELKGTRLSRRSRTTHSERVAERTILILTKTNSARRTPLNKIPRN